MGSLAAPATSGEKCSRSTEFSTPSSPRLETSVLEDQTRAAHPVPGDTMIALDIVPRATRSQSGKLGGRRGRCACAAHRRQLRPRALRRRTSIRTRGSQIARPGGSSDSSGCGARRVRARARIPARRRGIGIAGAAGAGVGGTREADTTDGIMEASTHLAMEAWIATLRRARMARMAVGMAGLGAENEKEYTR